MYIYTEYKLVNAPNSSTILMFLLANCEIILVLQCYGTI